MAIPGRFRAHAAVVLLLTLVSTATAKYSGGSGTAQDPYQIATAADLILLGDSPGDYDKHFILTADIDLDPNLPGGRVFDKAVIAPDTDSGKSGFQGTLFKGVFNGDGHRISHSTIKGNENYLALFGYLGDGGVVKNLGAVEVKITGLAIYVGGLVGHNSGEVTHCYSTGLVSGAALVGGLVGDNNSTVSHCYSAGVVSGHASVGGLVGESGIGSQVSQCYTTSAVSGKGRVGGLVGENYATLAQCYSTGAVSGTGDGVGGLVGENLWYGAVTDCHSTGSVTGDSNAGGLVGANEGTATQCYSTGAVSGNGEVGGLVGRNQGNVTQCYSTGAVTGNNSVGGLVGDNGVVGDVIDCYATGAVFGKASVGGLVGCNAELMGEYRRGGIVTRCYSGGAVSGSSDAGGLVGRNGYTVSDSVWDMQSSTMSASAGGIGLLTTEMMNPYMLGLNGFAKDPNWVLDPGRDYPRLAWEGTPGQIISEPDIDWLEGQGKPESPYRIDTADQLILLGRASSLWDRHFVLSADIDLDPNLPGRQVFRKAMIQIFTGVLYGSDHTISHLTIKGGHHVGLFGQLATGAEVHNLGVVNANIIGSGSFVGALVGSSGDWYTQGGSVDACYSTGAVNGSGESVGGLVGFNCGDVTECYSTCLVSARQFVGGLVGLNGASVTECYSVGAVTGEDYVGGIVGSNAGAMVSCFWDIETSGQTTSAGGIGKTTAQMKMASTFAGWGACGPLWTIRERQDYPHLAWEDMPGEVIAGPTYGGGTGTAEDPYLIYTAEHLNSMGLAPCHLDKCFKLMADIDLSAFDDRDGRPAFSIIAAGAYRGSRWIRDKSVFYGTPFTGVFDGNGHTISHLTITRDGLVGLFGRLEAGAEVRDLGVVDMSIAGSGYSSHTGGLAAYSSGSFTGCYASGTVSGASRVGGLVGCNDSGTVTQCYSTGAVRGTDYVGGLVGTNSGTLSKSWSTGSVSGTQWAVGGLVGYNGGTVSGSCSTGSVSGNQCVGGLVGENRSTVSNSYCRGSVSGNQYGGDDVGGLVGWNDTVGTVANSYSTGMVKAAYTMGGLVGYSGGIVLTSFWDTHTSGQTKGGAGTGKTTAEMQTAKTFLDAGWDFVGETANGTADIWWILEGKDYPHLWWEARN